MGRGRYPAAISGALLAALATASGWTAEPSPAVAPPSSGYVFVKGKVKVCAYECTHDVEWESGGDKLAYHHSLAWRFSLEPVEVGAEQVELSIRILHVRAAGNGPGSTHLVDSGLPADSNGHDDVLFGHLLELTEVPLTVLVDPRTGQVGEVRGGDEIVKKIDQRAPAAIPGDPPPLHAQSAIAYSSSALAQIWSQMLALAPAQGGEQILPLNSPLTGSLARHWTGSSYTVSLPTGTDHLDGQLLKDPTPVFATLSQLDGKGQVTLKNGAPESSAGEYRYTVTLNALTQPVVQHHHIQWGLHVAP